MEKKNFSTKKVLVDYYDPIEEMGYLKHAFFLSFFFLLTKNDNYYDDYFK
jgi:hypothetical protein